MEVINKPSFTGRTALWYVTVGAITVVWSAIWYTWLYQHRTPDQSQAQWYVCTGFFLSGLSLILIGMCAGPITQLYNKEVVPTPASRRAIAAEHAAAAAPPQIQPIIVTTAPPAPAPAPTAVPAAPPVAGTPPAPPADPGQIVPTRVSPQATTTQRY